MANSDWPFIGQTVQPDILVGESHHTMVNANVDTEVLAQQYEWVQP